MWDEKDIHEILGAWGTILGSRIRNVSQYPERDL